MSNSTGRNNMAGGIIKQLHSMLTNHSDRPRHVVNVKLNSSSGELLDSDMFEFYANEPISKIQEKVEKMRGKGGIRTLKILELKKDKDNEYVLNLSV